MVSNYVLIALFTLASKQQSLPNGLISALCFVESSHKISAVHFKDGKDDSIGVCQVQPKTANFLKFKGSKAQLMDPSINITYAARYLKYQLRRYNGDVYKAVAAYNAGSYIEAREGIAINHNYVRKVINAWAGKK